MSKAKGLIPVFLLALCLALLSGFAAADDHGNSLATATTISVGSVTGGVIELAGDKDYFKFTVPTTATYVVYTRGVTNTRGTLYNASYAYLAADINSGENDNFKIVQTLSPGVYYVEVSGEYSSTVGAYQLHVEGPGGGTLSAVSVSPASGSWTATPQYLAVNSSGATALYYQMVNTYDGSTPADPAVPTPSANNGSLAGPSASFQYYGAARLLKKTKLRFVGCNSAGCGPASPVYSYSIDLRVPLEQTAADRKTLGVTCTTAASAGVCASTSTKAVIITHGYDATASTWVSEMAQGVCHRVSASPQFYSSFQADSIIPVCSGSGWDVWIADWRTMAFTQAGLPSIAWVNASNAGAQLATYFLDHHQYQHFHLIAHSAGSNLIDTATPYLRSSGATVHETFLDAFDPSALLHPTFGGRHISRYGKDANVADNYVDIRVVGDSVLDTTDLHLTHGYNINVTPVNDGCGIISPPCSHSRPYRFYGLSVNSSFVGNADYAANDPIPINGTAGMGFNFSMENSRSLSTLQGVYPDNGECSVGADNVCHPVGLFVPTFISYLPGTLHDTTVIAAVGTANYVVGAVNTATNTAVSVFNSLKLGVTNLLPGASATAQRARSVPTATATSTATEPPSWVVVNVTTTGPVNTLRFNWRFAVAGEGLLRIYVNDTPAREIDQRHVPLVSPEAEEVYVGGDSGTLPPGTHKIAFRLDGFGVSASGVELTNVELGLVTAALPGPQAGWWWNPAQSGRGFTIEVSGNNMFMAGYLYADDGRATWLVSTGPMTQSNLYSGKLLSFGGGQTLSGSFKPNTLTNGNVGDITLQFIDATHGTLTWPGGTIPIERFIFASGTPTFQPETGWWWNEAESGRGFAIEIQGNRLFMAGYMYDDGGNPIWYVTEGAMATPTLYQGAWLQFANGQTLTGPFKQNQLINGNAGGITLQFNSSTTATLTLPGGRQIPLTRFRF